MNFDLFRRHFIFGTAIEAVNFRSAQTNRSTHAVHRGITAADNDGFAGIGSFAILHNIIAQEVDTGSCQFFAFATDGGRVPAADRDTHCIKIFLQLFQRKVFAQLGIEFKFHAQLFEVRHFHIQHVAFGQAVFRNAVADHPAGFRHLLINFDRHTHTAQIISGTQTGRAGADDSDFFAGFGRKFFYIFAVIKVSGIAFEIIDGNRFAKEILAALFFAETGADATDTHGQRNAFFDDLQGFQPVAFFTGTHIFFYRCVGRAGHGAGRFAVAGVFA